MLSTLDTTCTYRWQLILKCCFKPGWIGGPRAVEFGGDTITDLSLLAGRLLGSSLLAAVRLSIFFSGDLSDIKIHVLRSVPSKKGRFWSLGHWYATTHLEFCWATCTLTGGPTIGFGTLALETNRGWDQRSHTRPHPSAFRSNGPAEILNNT